MTPVPERPARPVRPTRCVYALSSSGGSKLITCVTSSRSRPRAATSVAISVVTLPVSKRSSARCALALRLVAVHRDRAGRPVASSLRASRSAPRFVRTKTSARPRSASSSSTSFSTFVSAVTETKWWSISPGVVLARQLGLDPRRRLRVGAGELADLAVERRREEHRLALAREPLDDPVDLRLEAHVEHPVGLVEDEDLDRVERDEPAVDQVLETAGRGDDHVGVAGEVRLRPERDTAVDGGDDEAARARRATRSPRSPGRTARASGRGRARPGARRRWGTRSTIGIAKASVLPEPVGDFASRSVPASAGGIARVWIWKGLTMPRASSACGKLRAHAERGEGIRLHVTPVFVMELARDLRPSSPTRSRKKRISLGDHECRPCGER